MPIPDGDPVFSSAVEVELRDGTTHRTYQAGFRGHPVRPASAGDIEDKFRENAGGVLGPELTEAVVAAVGRLDDLATVAEVTGLLSKENRDAFRARVHAHPARPHRVPGEA
jgi:hypothetical protein